MINLRVHSITTGSGRLALAALLMLAALSPASAAGERVHADDLMIFGASPSSIGRGGTGAALPDTPDAHLNPASPARFRHAAVSVNYGFNGPGLSHTGFFGGVPTSYGYFGVFGSALSVPESDEDAGEGECSAGLLGAGGARALSANLDAGYSLGVSAGSIDSADFGWAGAGLGLIYRIPLSVEWGRGFGFYSPSLGLSGFAGYAFGDRTGEARFDRAAAGTALGFFRNETVLVTLLADVTAVHEWEDVAVRMGIEACFRDSLFVRAGSVAPSSAHGFGAYTLGAGIALTLLDARCRLDYALMRMEGSSPVHYAGFQVSGDTPDTDPPGVEVSPRFPSFSPNDDGVMDTAEFIVNVSDAGRVRGWRFQVLGGDGAVLHESRHVARDISSGFFNPALLARLWRHEQADVVPFRIRWDGRDGAGVRPGVGKYRYSFMAWDEYDNIAAAREGFVYIDMTKPSAGVDAVKDIAPAGSGEKVVVRQKIVPAAFHVWKGVFRHESGRDERAFNWTSGEVPEYLAWDGARDDGKPARPGCYSYLLRGEDPEGNTIEASTRNIYVHTPPRIAAARCNREYLSHSTGPKPVFSISKTEHSPPGPWNLVIEDGGGRAVCEFRGETLPVSLEWNGMDTAGRPVGDGTFAFRAIIRDGTPEGVVSPAKTLTVDSTPPRLSVRVRPGLFTPDGDGIDDMLSIRPRFRDMSPISEWKIEILDPAGSTLYSWKGNAAIPNELFWNGRSVHGALVDSMERYAVRLFAVDAAGNRSVEIVGEIRTGILVNPECGGFHSRLFGGFVDYSDSFAPEFDARLGRLSAILRRYRNYDIRIEAHTDHRGDDHFNLELSEKRARALTAYFESDGSRRGIEFRGMGETIPLVPYENPDSVRKNCRIEIFFTPRDRLAR